MTEYFDTELPKIQILSDNYPQQHSDDNEYILGVNQLIRPMQIEEKYSKIFGTILNDEGS